MEKQIRENVVELAREAEEAGLIKFKSGNFSIMDRENSLIYITPSGIARKDLTEDKIAVLDINGNIKSAPYKPSSEYLMHIAAYKTREDISAVCHSHSLYATTFASAGIEIPPVSIEAVHYGANVVPVADYGTPGTHRLADSIIEPLKHSDCCLLKYHGALTVGDSPETALVKLIYVEENAKVYYNLMTLGIKNLMPVEIFGEIKNA